MTRLENDPRLTAYALGELDAAEQAEIEAILAADPAARAAVASIRAAAHRLSASLAVEPTPTLDDFRRADLATAIRATPIRTRSASEGLSSDHEPATAASETLARASGSDSLYAAPAVAPTTRILRPWWVNISAAAAAVLLVGIGFVALGPERTVVVPGLGVGGGTDVLRESAGLKVIRHLAPVRMDNLTSGDEVARKDIDGDATPMTTPGDRFAVERAAGNSPGIFIQPAETQLAQADARARLWRGPSAGSEAEKSLFLLSCRGQPTPGRFIAPSSGDNSDNLRNVGVYNSGQHAGDTASVAYAVRHKWNRFDFAGQPNLSYGYQVPFGTRGKPGERMDVLAALKADLGPYFQARGDELFSISNLSDYLWLDGAVAQDAFRVGPNGVQDLAFGLPFVDADDASFNLPPLGWKDVSAETYGPVQHNPFLLSSSNPLSTFSIDVDTASYANVRRFLLSGQLPPPAAVRIEEFLNYFTYDYPIPGLDTDDSQDYRLETGVTDSAEATPPPFSSNMEIAACPWAPQNRLVRIGLRGWEPSADERPTANLVFLVDVSGSMNEPNKLPLVVQSLKLLVERLRDDDRIAIAVYAGASGLALPSTLIRERASINAALDNLSAGGSTNGGEGINLAYRLASDSFITNGINRVILCTDGDFNVGIADRNELQALIETKAKSGVFLSVLGFGMGNLKDATLETLADRGNGNYAYIDSLDEARKVLVDQMGGTLQTIAKDVKIQVEFNPAAVGAYRLLGYENRMLAAQDFNDDTKDAGEIGAGHTVTALYEVVPVGVAVPEIADSHAGAGEAIRAPSASARGFVRTGVDLEQHPRASVWGSDSAATFNDVVPPPPTPIILETETPEFLAPDPAIDPLKYQTPDQLIAAHSGGPLELLTLKLRDKAPDGDESNKLEFVLDDAATVFDDASPDFRFAAAVAGFAMNLRGTPHIAAWPLAAIAETALSAMGQDADMHRAEFLSLVKQAQVLQVERAQ